MGEWNAMTLATASVTLIDCGHKTPQAVEHGYPYVTIPEMKNGRIDFANARKISYADFIEWTKKAKPQLYDVVLSRRTNPGVTASFGAECEFALGQNLVLLRADGTHVLPEFLRWLVSSPAWWSQIEKFNNVGAVFDSLRCADMREVSRPGLPSP
jgi:type I restriction enzyme S subunit